MLIFGIGRLNTAATNNILLILAGKPTNIGIDYCYQPIPIMDPRCYNRSFSSSIGQPCVELHNYYINNYKSGQGIIVSYKDCHFLVGDSFFLISFSDLYDLFNLDALGVSLMR
jgi:hypothetical protein